MKISYKCWQIFLLLGILSWMPSVASASKKPGPYNTPQQKAAFDKRMQQFGRFWMARRKGNVTPQLLHMMDKEPTQLLRERIVIALGRIEGPQAIEPLQALLKIARQSQSSPSSVAWRDSVPPFRITMALARIRARDLKGTAKLSAIAKSVGTDWEGIKRKATRLRAQLQDKRTLYEAQQSDDREIVEEFYDVLYRMGKHGENIQSLGIDQLPIWSSNPRKMPDALHSHEQALLQAASLSDAQEVTFWLQRAMLPNMTLFDPAHLLDLNAPVKPELATYLKNYLGKIKDNPQLVARNRSYTSLFEAAAATGDESYLPILKQFQNVNDKWTKIYAGRVVRQLQAGGSGILFP